jgi:hypothetical protein
MSLAVSIDDIDGERCRVFCAYCDHCKKAITDLESAWSLWYEFISSVPNGRYVPIDHLHEECLTPTIRKKSRKIVNVRWFGCLVLEMKKEAVTVHEFDLTKI